MDAKTVLTTLSTKDVHELLTQLGKEATFQYNNETSTPANELVLTNWLSGLSDVEHEVTQSFSGEASSTCFYNAKARHTDTYRGFAATNKEVHYNGCIAINSDQEGVTHIVIAENIQPIIEKINAVNHKTYSEEDFDSSYFNCPGKAIYLDALYSRQPAASVDQMLVDTCRRDTLTISNYHKPNGEEAEKLFNLIETHEVTLPLADRTLTAYLHQPKDKAHENLPLIYYAHGGSWFMTDAKGYDLACKKLAHECQANVFVIDFRLIPEHPFPACFNDCSDGYRWLTENLASLSLNPSSIFIGGDSAGGNLATHTVFEAIKNKWRKADGALLLSATLDLEFEKYPSYHTATQNNPFVSAGAIAFARSALVPYALWQDPKLSPINGDLSAFPPCFIMTTTQDWYLDSSKAFLDKLQKQQVENCEIKIFEGVPHDFHVFIGQTDTEQQAYQAIKQFVDKISH